MTRACFKHSMTTQHLWDKMQAFKTWLTELCLSHDTPSPGAGRHLWPSPLPPPPDSADDTVMSGCLPDSLPKLERFKSQDVVVWLTQHPFQTLHSLLSSLSQNDKDGIYETPLQLGCRRVTKLSRYTCMRLHRSQ